MDISCSKASSPTSIVSNDSYTFFILVAISCGVTGASDKAQQRFIRSVNVLDQNHSGVFCSYLKNSYGSKENERIAVMAFKDIIQNKMVWGKLCILTTDPGRT